MVFGNSFLVMTPKAQVIKQKIRKWDDVEIKNSRIAKETIKKNKKKKRKEKTNYP